jgi:glycosyltransferase involved in cell wall biosynthesis
MTQKVPLSGFDAVMVSSEGIGNLVPLRSGDVPVFCLCLTPLKVVYDPFTRDRFFSQRSTGLLTRLAIGLYTRVDRLGWSRYHRVFCISVEVASRVLNADLAPSKRVEVLYPGVDLDRFDYQSPSEPYFLLSGRIARTKNVELGIDAFVRFKADTPGSGPFRLVIAGMVDEKSRPYLLELQNRARGRSDIAFVVEPSDDELRDLYRRCYATLFTSLNEDLGLVVLEAMASGKSVVAACRGGPLEMVVHSETGLLCSPEPEAFAPAMAALVADAEWSMAMGKAGRRRVAMFSWDRFVRRLDEYVDDVIRKPDPVRSGLVRP